MLNYMIFTRVSYWLKIWGSKSSSAINFIKDPTFKLHVYAVLIQDVKDMIEQSNIIVYHTLREENQCADFFARLGASSDSDLFYHVSPPYDLLYLLKMDAAETFFFIV